MSPKTDIELVNAFREGDEACFNELVRRYQQRVYWVARRVMGTHEDADDIVQDAFVRVYEGLAGFRGDANFYTWLYRITMNLALNALRKKRIRDVVPFDHVLEEALPGDSQSDQSLHDREYQALLEQAVARLPVKQKAVFIMRYFDEMTYEEMAKVTKKSVGGLKANYFHALKKVAEFIRKEMEL